MAVPNMIVTLAMNATKYASGLRKAAGDTTRFGQFTTKAFNVAKGALLGLTLAVVRFIPELANMGAESRKADIQMRFMLENMQGISNATNLTIKRLSKYADTVSMATGIDDEQVKTVQKKLLMFKAVRKSADEMGGAFDRATMAAIDLAAGGFGTMETNARQLGKMLESPLSNLNALSRAGVVFTNAEKDKIGVLVESGKLLEAQELILGRIEGRVQGLAEESATPWEKMMAALQEIGDSIGEALLDPLDDMNTKIKVWLASPDAKSDIKRITDGFVAMGEAASIVLDTLLTIKAGIKTVSDAWGNGPVGWMVDAFSGGTTKNGFVKKGGNQSAPGGRPKKNNASTIINFNAPVDSVSAGREVSRVLNAYNRANGRGRQ